MVAFGHGLLWLLVKGCGGFWSRDVVTFGQELWWLFVTSCGGFGKGLWCLEVTSCGGNCSGVVVASSGQELLILKYVTRNVASAPTAVP